MAVSTAPILRTPNLICFWDFSEPAGSLRVAQGPCRYPLQERGGVIERVNEGIFTPHSAKFGSGAWLDIPRADCPALNIHGEKAQVSVVAWIKRAPLPERGCEAVAGIWNEHSLRQYCLFLNLGIHESRQQVGAHISSIGGATPGYKYCMDVAIGATPVPFDQWQCVAISYDATYARAYLNGRLDVRGDRNPYHYPGGIFDGGPHGGDFTVGAVARPETVDENRVPHGHVQSNLFLGLLGGLAVFNRALTDDEMLHLSRSTGLE